MINKEIDELIKSFFEFFENTSSQKKLNVELVQQGWYPNTITIRYKKLANEPIDDFMMRCLTGRYYRQIKEDYFYHLYPHRRHIYEEAFKLYEEDRHLAAIPLFLSQIDGIIQDSGLSGMFHDNKKLGKKSTPEKLIFCEYLNHHIDLSNSKINSKSLLSYYQPIIQQRNDLIISKPTYEISHPNNIGQLNRHGILHGNRDYLHYDAPKNTLKVISLTLFVMQSIEQLKLESHKSLTT